MTSLFIGTSGTRIRFAKLNYTDVVSATSQATSIMLAAVKNACRFTYFSNKTDADLVLLAVHPDSDATVVTNRLLITEIPAGDALNFEYGLFAGLSVDPGTEFYVYMLTVPTKGIVRLSYWG